MSIGERLWKIFISPIGAVLLSVIIVALATNAADAAATGGGNFQSQGASDQSNQSNTPSTPTPTPTATGAPASCSKLIAGGQTDRWISTTSSDITGTAQLAPSTPSVNSTPAPTASPTPIPTDSPTATPTPVPTAAASPVKIDASLKYDFSIRRGRYFETLGSSCAPTGKQYVVVLYSGTPTLAVTDGYGYNYGTPTPDTSNTKYTLTSGSESYQPQQTLEVSSGTAVVFETPKNESSFGFTSTLAFTATRDTSNDSAVKSEDPNYESVPTTIAANFTMATVRSVPVTTAGETCTALVVDGSGQDCNENVSGGF